MRMTKQNHESTGPDNRTTKPHSAGVGGGSTDWALPAPKVLAPALLAAEYSTQHTHTSTQSRTPNLVKQNTRHAKHTKHTKTYANAHSYIHKRTHVNTHANTRAHVDTHAPM